MSFPKNIPFRSRENIKKKRHMNCENCGKNPPSDAHHIKTRGSGGGDELENLIALCRACHTKVHMEGLKKAMGDRK
jgi:5-methylcytosine-specific restriction endonuclease McrA